MCADFRRFSCNSPAVWRNVVEQNRLQRAQMVVGDIKQVQFEPGPAVLYCAYRCGSRPSLTGDTARNLRPSPLRGGSWLMTLVTVRSSTPSRGHSRSSSPQSMEFELLTPVAGIIHRSRALTSKLRVQTKRLPFLSAVTSRISMAKHPNEYELRRIRLTRQILTAVAVAMVIVIGILAAHGNFRRRGTYPPAAPQHQR